MTWRDNQSDLINRVKRGKYFQSISGNKKVPRRSSCGGTITQNKLPRLHMFRERVSLLYEENTVKKVRHFKVCVFGPIRNCLVAVWPDHFYNIWLFTSRNICPVAWKLAKVGSQFCHGQNKPPMIANYFIFVAKVAKFQQNWSHCLVSKGGKYVLFNFIVLVVTDWTKRK